MRIRVRAAYAAAGLLGAATFAVSSSASAQSVSACTPAANNVYVAGSSAFQTVLQAVANVLGSSVNIIYQSPGSCQGMQNILEGMIATGSAKQLVPSNSPTSCSLPSVDGGGTPIDIGVSDVFVDTCKANYDANLPSPLPSGFKDFLGPVQAMTFAVPTASTENIISAEAAYMVFGFGAGTAPNTINPWNVPTDIFVRKNDSGTLEMLATAINLPGQKWVNSSASPAMASQQASGTGGMQTDITHAATLGGTHANSTIGILSTAGLITGIKPLAFQGVGQRCSYLPDSSSSTTDKINVRQGRYEVWGPEHVVAAVDGNGKPVGQNGNTAAVQTLINALLSTSQALPAQSDAGAGDSGATDGGGVTTLGETEVGQLITAISPPNIGFIPWCAMQVTRTSEIGAESSYAPPVGCSCAFEYANGTPVEGHTCTACTASNESTICTGATTHCRFGYCEAE